MMKRVISMLKELLSVTHKIDDEAMEERRRAIEHDQVQGLNMARLERQLEMLRLAEKPKQDRGPRR